MHFSTVAALAVTAAAAPAHFPFHNGFPMPNMKHIEIIENHAGGTIPNTPLPTKGTKTAKTDLQVIATNEIHETFFFTELLQNVTNDMPGYKLPKAEKEYAMKSLMAIRAQEELHALGANSILKSIGAEEVQPCKYHYPVDNYMDAIALAATFTDVVLGTLQGVMKDFALDGGQEPNLIPLIGSIIGQEGEQDGVFRLLQKKVPSAAPFLTTSAGAYAYNAVAQMFIVPGSCPSAKNIDVPAFDPLTVESTPMPKNMMLKYSVMGKVDPSKMELAYISGQNYPVTVPIKDVMMKGGMTMFSAMFPFESGFSKGLTLSAVVMKQKAKFMDANAVADATMFGPGLIEVD